MGCFVKRVFGTARFRNTGAPHSRFGVKSTGGAYALADLRLAWRLARRYPVLTVVVVLTLAVGVAATTAVFGLVNAVWFRSLSYPAPEQLVAVHQVHPALGESAAIPGATYEIWRTRSRSFDALGACAERTVVLGTGGDAQRIRGLRISSSLLRLLGARPLLGRVPTEEDEANGGVPRVLVSQRFWKRALGSNRQIVGEPLTLDGAPATVVGVLPYEFRVLDSGYEVFLPLPNPAGDARLRVVARLRAGVSLDEAALDLRTLDALADAGRHAAERRWRARLTPLADEMWHDARRLYVVLLAAAMLFLGLACANVSHLLLALALHRRREFAIRLALGAGRLGVIRQLLVEGGLLAIVSGIAAVTLCLWLHHLLVASFPEMTELRMDHRVFLFAFAVTTSAGLALALAPAWCVSRMKRDPSLAALDTLPVRYRLGRLLGGGQMAMAAALLATSGAVARSVVDTKAIDPGFRTDRLLVGSFALPPARYAQVDEQALLLRDLQARLARVAQFQSVAAASKLPLDGGVARLRIEVEGRPPAVEGEAREAAYTTVTPSYFDVLRLPTTAGERFESRDIAQPVAVVNRTLAAALWGDESRAVGARVRVDGREWRRVIGVVADARQVLTEPPYGEIYVPPGRETQGGFCVLARTAAEPLAAAPALRAALRDVDSGLALWDVTSMTSIVDSYCPTPVAAAFVGLAVLSLLLGTLGLYAVTAFVTARRAREFAIRTALGSGRTRLAGLVLAGGLRMTAGGLGAGLVIAGLLGLALSRQFFGVRAFDPIITAVVAVVLAAVTLASCVLPAFRAARVDPAASLRAE